MGTTVSAQSTRLEAIWPGAGATVELKLTGPASRFHRIERSRDLLTWEPQALLDATNAVKTLAVSVLETPVLFFRAVEVDPVLELAAVTPAVGSVGTLVDITGQFLGGADGLDTRVKIAGVEMPIVESSPVRIRIRIPEALRSSGPVEVTSPYGHVIAAGPFLLTRGMMARVAPPAGWSAADFQIGNTLTGSLQPGAGGMIEVRAGLPLLNLALPRSEAESLALMAVSTGTENEVVISARSTAVALLFVSPLFGTSDPELAPQFLGLIATNAAVEKLGEFLGAWAPGRGDPLTNGVFLQAYGDALGSVLTNRAVQALAEGARRRAAWARSSGLLSSTDYPIDLDSILVSKLSDAGRSLQRTQRRIGADISVHFPYYNPVDWIVEIREIDVERAFPLARDDFNRVWRSGEVLRFFPLKSGFEAQKGVGAQLVTDWMNPVKKLAGEFLNAITAAIAGPEQPVTFPDRDGLYVLRGIGPAFTPLDEAGFVFEHHTETRVRVVALNLVSAALDVLNVLIDSEVIKLADSPAFRAKLITEAIRKEPLIRTPGDVLSALPELVKFALVEIADKLKENALKAGAAAATRKAAEKIASILTGSVDVLKQLDIAGGIGQVAQRVYGMASTTPLESAFVMIGDPFHLSIISIQPGVAGPGDTVELTFRGPASMPTFVPDTDQVTFEGREFFDGRVIEVRRTGSSPLQTLKLELPANVPLTAGGAYTVVVAARGRRGEHSFELATDPRLTSLEPREGFAATDNFLGGTFAGSQIRVRGVNISAADDYFFAGSTGRVAVARPEGLPGDVLLRVPAGAVSGPVVVRQNRSGAPPVEAIGPQFQVLGAPRLLAVEPLRGPVNTLVTARLENAGADPGSLRVEFGNALESPVQILPGGVVLFRVPTGARTGAITLRTPAGAVQTAPFEVLPGLAAESSISVGGASLITLERAAAFANGAALPTDDIDAVLDAAGNVVTPLDPPFEEGDFLTDLGARAPVRWPVGAGFGDAIWISGTVTGTLELTGEYDIARGGLGGSGQDAVIVGDVILRGNRCTITLVDVIGTVTILGDYNSVSVNARDSAGHGIVIRGHHNSVGGVSAGHAGDGVRIEGNYNNVNLTACYGNGGNGITVTSGARHNEVRLLGGGSGPQLHGNARHGIALLESASWNFFYGTLLSNALDGIYLDGPTVLSNRFGDPFRKTTSAWNGRNGLTITNGAAWNTVGDGIVSGRPGIATVRLQTALCASNGMHGAVLGGSGWNRLTVSAVANAGDGLLVTDYAAEPGPFPSYVETAIEPALRPNGGAGVRLTGNVSGFGLIGDLRRETIGLVLQGAGVRSNMLGGPLDGPSYVGAYASDALRVNANPTAGALLQGAQDNQLRLDQASGSGGHGVVLEGGDRNELLVREAYSNRLAGVVFRQGARANALRSLRPGRNALLQWNGTGVQLESAARENVIESVGISRALTNGLVLTGSGTVGNQVRDTTISRGAGLGVWITAGASDNLLGNPSGTRSAFFVDNHPEIQIRVDGADTAGNHLRLCRISSGAASVGLLITGGAPSTLVDDCNFGSLGSGIVVRGAGAGTQIRDCFISFNNDTGIRIEDTAGTLIGGSTPGDGNSILLQRLGLVLTGSATRSTRVEYNSISSHREEGVVIEGGAGGNLVRHNSMRANREAIRIAGAQANNILLNTLDASTGDHIRLEQGAARNRIHGNTIRGARVGVRVHGAGSTGNSILQNSIYANPGGGIRLEQGGNRARTAPQLLLYDGVTVSGRADTPDGSRIEIFTDLADQGQTFAAAGEVRHGAFRVPFSSPRSGVGALFRINGTVTDPDGNTSEFSGLAGAADAVGRLAFTSTRDGNREIYYLEGNASSRRLTRDPAADFHPSPCGDTVLFVSDRTGSLELFTMTAFGFGVRQITTNTVADYDPAWIPGCAAFVFVSERDGNAEIYRMELADLSVTRLTTHPARDYQPRVSPDGKQLVFVSERDGNPELYLMNLDGSGLRRLTDQPAADTQPAWTAAGGGILFVSERDGNPEIYRVRGDGSGLVRLTEHPGRDESPDGLAGDTVSIFSSDRDGPREIYLLNEVTRRIDRLTVEGGENFGAASRVP